MKLFACAILGATTLALVSTTQAFAGLSGEYTVVFLSGPTHKNTGKQCVTFTNTGTIDGFPDSGTWNSSTDTNWGGNFVVEGNFLRWYGTFDNATGATSAWNHISDDIPGKGGSDQWTVSAPPITTQDEALTRFHAGCRSHASRPGKPF